MPDKLRDGDWQGVKDVETQAWQCGYCGREVASGKGWVAVTSRISWSPGFVVICPRCNAPTVLLSDDGETYAQFPWVPVGRPVEHLPTDVEGAYDSARRAFAVRSFDGGAMVLRNLIAHVAVDLGAETGQAYAAYVAWLHEQGRIPPGADEWVDRLRQLGNETAHELITVTEDEAMLALNFAELLLRYVYEAPGRMRVHASTPDAAADTADGS